MSASLYGTKNLPFSVCRITMFPSSCWRWLWQRYYQFREVGIIRCSEQGAQALHCTFGASIEYVEFHLRVFNALARLNSWISFSVYGAAFAKIPLGASPVSDGVQCAHNDLERNVSVYNCTFEHPTLVQFCNHFMNTETRHLNLTDQRIWLACVHGSTNKYALGSLIVVQQTSRTDVKKFCSQLLHVPWQLNDDGFQQRAASVCEDTAMYETSQLPRISTYALFNPALV